MNVKEERLRFVKRSLQDEQTKNVKKGLLKQINENIQKRIKEKEAQKNIEDIYFYSHYEKDLHKCEGCPKKVPSKTLTFIDVEKSHKQLIFIISV